MAKRLLLDAADAVAREAGCVPYDLRRRADQVLAAGDAQKVEWEEQCTEIFRVWLPPGFEAEPWLSGFCG